MIICHCMSITDRDIRSAVDWMRAADPDTLITPGKVYRALGKRADCGGCLPVFLDTMHQCDTFVIPTEAGADGAAASQGDSDERRREGYRVP
jgi:bacterioferritin-associated ferredoxin